MPIYRKQRGGRWYLYEQHSYREGKKVRTRSRYLGPVNSAKDPFALEPGEVQADNAMQQWVADGGPERLQQEKQPAWSQEQFLADTAAPAASESESNTSGAAVGDGAADPTGEQ